FHERIIEELGKKTPILAMGDFNDEPFDRSLTEHARCERQRAKVVRAKTATFLNLMWPLTGRGIGSHYFNNDANLLDQFLASRSLLTGDGKIAVVENSAGIERFPEMAKKGDYPAPIRFGRGKELNVKGFSDHFPISVKLEEA
ncbi:MAG: endonuclease/exonuclease/phosphatase family protein, partial [Bacteroidota bacterium]